MKLNGKDTFLLFLKGKSFEHKGDYDATAIYQSTSQIVDCVFYNGSSYFCKKTTTAGIAPTNTEYWGVLASEGRQGLQGKQGEQGVQGLPGEKGEKGEKGETGAAGKDGVNGVNGKDGAGCYINGAATNVNFTSDPQTQLNNLNNNKANKDLSNVTYPTNTAGSTKTGAGDRVIETYISSDGNTWYRKYASGWKECGLQVEAFGSQNDSSSSRYINITLPISFSNSNYTVVAIAKAGSSCSNGIFKRTSSTNTVLELGQRDQNGGASVYVCGY